MNNSWLKFIAGVAYGLIIGICVGIFIFYKSPDEVAAPSPEIILVETNSLVPEPDQSVPIEPVIIEKPKPAPVKNNMLCNFMYALTKTESDFRHRGFKGSSGERGFTQLRKCTWIDGCKYLHVKWSYQPHVWERQKNITVSTGYICWLFDRWYAKGYRGDTLIKKVCNSYNYGFSNILRGKMTNITRRHYSRFRRTFDYVMETEKYKHGEVKGYIDNAVEFVKSKKTLKWLKD